MGILDKLRARKNIIRAAAYARFSSDNQREESIDAQLRAIHDYAGKNNIIITAEYIDRAKSATTDNRPEFLKMISDSSKDNFEIVFVHKLDRFARNRYDSIGYRIELKKNNVSLISILENLDDDTPESIILESMLEAMAEYYSKNLSREVQKGMKENALKGVHTGGVPPLGYDLDPKTRLLVINEREAIAVRRIFRLFIEGLGYHIIIRELNQEGYLTKNGVPFGKNSLHTILQNEKYTGVYVFNKTVKMDMNGKRNSHKYKDPEEVIRIKGIVPQIISEDIFQKVQEKMAARKRYHYCHTAKETYILSGKIVCGECGSAYAGTRKKSSRGKRYHITYRCSLRDRKTSGLCQNKEVRREYVEAFVLERLANCVFNDELLPLLFAEYKKFKSELNIEYVSRLDVLRKRMTENGKETANIVKVIAKTGSDALCNRLKELENEKLELETKLSQYESNFEDPLVTIGIVGDAFKKARQMLTEGKLNVLQKLVELYVQRVVVYQNRIEVFFNMGSDAYPSGLIDSREFTEEKEKYPTELSDGAINTSILHTCTCAGLVEARGICPRPLPSSELSKVKSG